MHRETATRLLKWWAGGAYVSQGLIIKAIDALVNGTPNPFVEECIRQRERVRGSS